MQYKTPTTVLRGTEKLSNENRGTSNSSLYKIHPNGPKRQETDNNRPARVKEETKTGLKSILWISYLYGVMVVLYGRILPLLLVLCSKL